MYCLLLYKVEYGKYSTLVSSVFLKYKKKRERDNCPPFLWFKTSSSVGQDLLFSSVLYPLVCQTSRPNLRVLNPPPNHIHLGWENRLDGGAEAEKYQTVRLIIICLMMDKKKKKCQIEQQIQCFNLCNIIQVKGLKYHCQGLHSNKTNVSHLDVKPGPFSMTFFLFFIKLQQTPLNTFF